MGTPNGPDSMPSPPGPGPDSPGTDPGGEGSSEFLQPRIRRLTNAELNATLQSLMNSFGASDTVVFEPPTFVPDTRQWGFSRNAAQIVDPLLARVARRLAGVAPCASAGADRACAGTALQTILPVAYRRDVSADEVDQLLTVFDSAATDGFDAAMALALSAALQSASFVYHTELGDSMDGASAQLNASETAAAMAYLLTGAPPDEALAAAAQAGELDTGSGRETQARRLLDMPGARAQVTRMVKEWLGIDAVVDIGKDKAQFPQYEQLRPHMLAETEAFVTEVVFYDGGNIGTLLGADYTVVGSEMAQFYGLSAPAGGAADRVSLASTTRRGILNQASFLARYATEIDSAPVKRGVVVAKKVMCVDPGDPNSLNINVVPPQPDPSMTTRERFKQHTVDPVCAGCHDGIDGLGFTFEGFDAVGAQRERDQGKPVDTATTLAKGWADVIGQGEFEDSADLADVLANSEEVKRCFTRHLDRFANAATNERLEDAFLAQWAQLEASKRDSILEILVAYVTSDSFVQRVAAGANP